MYDSWHKVRDPHSLAGGYSKWTAECKTTGLEYQMVCSFLST